MCTKVQGALPALPVLALPVLVKWTTEIQGTVQDPLLICNISRNTSYSSILLSQEIYSAFHCHKERAGYKLLLSSCPALPVLSTLGAMEGVTVLKINNLTF